MAENKNAKTPTDSGVGFIDGVWYGPGPTAWQCQCGKPYTVTCISSKPPKREWVGLTDEEVSEIIDKEIGFNSCFGPEESFARAIEAKLKEKNT
jgi:hypothetical protein